MRLLSLLLLVIFFASCNNNNNNPDVSGIKLDLRIDRFEKDFFNTTSKLINIPSCKTAGQIITNV